MNMSEKYYLAIYLKGGVIVHKEMLSVYVKSDAAAEIAAMRFAKDNNIDHDTIDVTYTGEEQF
jgi:hypothetical protein